jgi:hypothetical protein
MAEALTRLPQLDLLNPSRGCPTQRRDEALPGLVVQRDGSPEPVAVPATGPPASG